MKENIIKRQTIEDWIGKTVIQNVLKMVHEFLKMLIHFFSLKNRNTARHLGFHYYAALVSFILKKRGFSFIAVDASSSWNSFRTLMSKAIFINWTGKCRFTQQFHYRHCLENSFLLHKFSSCTKKQKIFLKKGKNRGGQTCWVDRDKYLGNNSKMRGQQDQNFYKKCLDRAEDVSSIELSQRKHRNYFGFDIPRRWEKELPQ